MRVLVSPGRRIEKAVKLSKQHRKHSTSTSPFDDLADLVSTLKAVAERDSRNDGLEVLHVQRDGTATVSLAGVTSAAPVDGVFIPVMLVSRSAALTID